MPRDVILGLHDGHNCGASLIADGRVVASVCEERLTRRKNEVGYPARAIEDVLAIAGVAASDLSAVVYASNFMHSAGHLTSVGDWYRVGIDQQRADAQRPASYGREIFELRRRQRIDDAVAHLGIAAADVHFVEHHLAHLAAAHFTNPFGGDGRRFLGLTCDGAGDGLSATVSVCQGDRIERLAATDRHASLGKIYSRATYLLGMTPWEHEYKVMGLAPYAEAARVEAAQAPFEGLLRVGEDGLTFATAGELSTNYCYFYLRDALERVRFDTVCGAVQAFTERKLIDWVRRAIAETGITDLVCGGGVFMNVKANMLIGELAEVTSLYVVPSSGDESLSFGAALHHWAARHPDKLDPTTAMPDLYLGAAFGDGDERAAVEPLGGNPDIVVEEPGDLNQAIADALAEGGVVAVCRGRMEWGARALGNRSILADPRSFAVVERINAMIKMRDFWMPFAPSIRRPAADRYFDPRRGRDQRFMMMACRSRPSAVGEIVAGTHPRDRTLRPQLVDGETNADYAAVIDAFERRTGVAAVLNTSFNLHGEPIVYSPADAVRVFLNSGLTHLALNHLMLRKRAAGPAGAAA